MKLVIIGGTGRIGSRIVALLRDLGHAAVPAAPNTGVNTVTGEGLAEALEGADVVIDVSNSPSLDGAAAFEFFKTSTGNLLAAEKAAGVQHHVVLSVVGTDRLIESGYFQAKLTQERLIERSQLPYTIVRATQFFEFIEAIAEAGADGDVVQVAPVLIQPMAADDVARAVTQAALGPPANATIDVGGPEVFRLDVLIRRAFDGSSDARQVIADPYARYYGAAVDERTLLPSEGSWIGQIRFGQWQRNAPRARAAASSVEHDVSSTGAYDEAD